MIAKTWTNEEIDFIRDNYSEKGRAYVAKELQCNSYAIEKQAHQMGIYKGRGIVDMTGEKYGDWTVISLGEKRSGGNTYWLCRCKCGTEKEVQRPALRNGSSKQCRLCAEKNGRDMEFYGEIPAVYMKALEKRSIKKRLKYNLDADYLNKLLVSQNRKCAISGVPLTIKKGTWEKSTASIDRIVPELEYIKGNVQWVHVDINYMKGKLTQKRFIELCKSVDKYQSLLLNNMNKRENINFETNY